MPTRESSNDIDSTAAGWAARLDRGPLSSEDQSALEAWTSADPRHLGALARALAISVRLGELARRDGGDQRPTAIRRPRG